MTEQAKFERGKNGLKAERVFTRRGVIGKKGAPLSEKDVARLHDDDVAALVAQGVVSVTSSATKAIEGKA